MMKRLVAFLTLFTSVSTLLCCALPALFVALGMGAVFAGLVGAFPQLIWISENKVIFFGIGAAMLALGGALQWNARKLACPIDPKLATACTITRDWSIWVYWVSVALYLIGAGFAFIPPLFYQE